MIVSKHERWRVRIKITLQSDVLTRTLDNPQFRPCIVCKNVCRLPAGCTLLLFFCINDMTNSRSIVRNDVPVDTSTRIQPLHHFLCEILEQFHHVGATAKKFGTVSWNQHIWAHFQANTAATLVTCLPLDRPACHFHSTSKGGMNGCVL